jgi:hypothetical protein
VEIVALEKPANKEQIKLDAMAKTTTLEKWRARASFASILHIFGHSKG